LAEFAGMPILFLYSNAQHWE